MGISYGQVLDGRPRRSMVCVCVSGAEGHIEDFLTTARVAFTHRIADEALIEMKITDWLATVSLGALSGKPDEVTHLPRAAQQTTVAAPFPTMDHENNGSLADDDWVLFASNLCSCVFSDSWLAMLQKALSEKAGKQNVVQLCTILLDDIEAFCPRYTMRRICGKHESVCCWGQW